MGVSHAGPGPGPGLGLGLRLGRDGLLGVVACLFALEQVGPKVTHLDYCAVETGHDCYSYQEANYKASPLSSSELPVE